MNEKLPPVPLWSMVNAFPNGGRKWGRLDAYYTYAPPSRPKNGSIMTYGHFLVSEAPEPNVARNEVIMSRPEPDCHIGT